MIEVNKIYKPRCYKQRGKVSAETITLKQKIRSLEHKIAYEASFLEYMRKGDFLVYKIEEGTDYKYIVSFKHIHSNYYCGYVLSYVYSKYAYEDLNDLKCRLNQLTES